MASAVGETHYNFVEGCEIQRQAREHGPLTILEVGFGTGLGFVLTHQVLKTGLTFVSTEIDPEVVAWAQKRHQCLSSLAYKNHPNGLNFFWLEKGHHKLIVLIGDARETLPTAHAAGLIPPLDAIYQDPFSPPKNPTLWTTQWFTLLRKLSNSHVILSTYSASRSVRSALEEAGMTVEKRRGFGKKRESTRAFLKIPQ